MTSTSAVTQGPSPEDDYGLDAVAQHNAAVSTEQFPEYQEDTKGLGIYGDDYYPADPSYIHNPPTPRSNDDGVRTRSGRSTRGRTDSPFSTGKSRVSKSPSARPRKDKKASKLDKTKTPKLTAPLSVLTKDMEVPLKDMEAWVHRSAEIRQAEVVKRNGYVTRPMNSFMLYRSAYAERTKQWCLQNNHQVVSSVSGESWPLEPEEVRNQFNEWAKTERDNHAKAHPDYKFSPSKAANKRRKGELTDDEDDASEVDLNDPEGEYQTGRRNVRQRRQIDPDAGAQAYLESNVGFSSHPYYGGQQGYDPNSYMYAGRPVPSNVAYDGTGLAYNPQTGAYVQISVHQHPQYGYVQDGRVVRVPTPASVNGSQSLGGYGMPGAGHMSAEDLFATTSRTSTPAMQAQYQQYGQPIAYPAYHSYTPQPYQQAQMQAQHVYEHQQYLQQASQPQHAIDPGLEAALAAAGHSQSHFDDAIGDLGSAGFDSIQEYFEESTSPNQTLAPSWSPTEALGGS